MIWNQDLYQKTILFAAEAHQGQTIPGTTISYVVHLSNVCMEVLAALSNQDETINIDQCMQGALLHDVLEDTKVSSEEFEEVFGEEVLKIVQALTKNEGLPKVERMLDILNRIRQVGKEAAIVKMADRIVNLQPPPSHWSLEKRQNYRREAKLILKNLGEFHSFLALRLEKKIEAYQAFC